MRLINEKQGNIKCENCQHPLRYMDDLKGYDKKLFHKEWLHFSDIGEYGIRCREKGCNCIKPKRS